MVSITTRNTLQPSVEGRRGHKRAVGGRNVCCSLKTSASPIELLGRWFKIRRITEHEEQEHNRWYIHAYNSQWGKANNSNNKQKEVTPLNVVVYETKKNKQTYSFVFIDRVFQKWLDEMFEVIHGKHHRIFGKQLHVCLTIEERNDKRV